MGSIKIYDLKREKWVPYVPDHDKWYQHFKDLSDQPDHMGRYIVVSGKRNRKLKEIEAQQRQKEIQNSKALGEMFTLVAQAIEIAKSEIKRKRKENGNESMDTNAVGGGWSAAAQEISKQTLRLTGIHSDIKRWTVNNRTIYCLDILSLFALRIKLKYREEDLSFPIQILAKDQENTG